MSDILDYLKARDTEYTRISRERFEDWWNKQEPKPPYEQAWEDWKVAYGWGWQHGMEEGACK